MQEEEGSGTHRDERALAEGHDPVLVPQEVEELGVVRALEVRHLERVVGVGVHAKVFDLVDRDRLVLGRGRVRRRVALLLWRRDGMSAALFVRMSWVKRTSGKVRKAPISTRPAETVRFGSICRCTGGQGRVERVDGSRTHDDGEEGVLELLVGLLGHDVDAREPAAVARVRVVPPDDVLGAADLFRAEEGEVDSCGSVRAQGELTAGELSMYWIMNSLASLAAFTRVSVPTTGRAKASMTIKVSPSSLPCMRPMISYWPPERACMTCGGGGL